MDPSDGPNIDPLLNPLCSFHGFHGFHTLLLVSTTVFMVFTVPTNVEDVHVGMGGKYPR